MKVNRRFLQIASGLCFLAGAILVVLTRKAGSAEGEAASDFGQWAGIGIMIIGMILLMPWEKSVKK